MPGSIETVRGRISEERAERLLAFWSRHGLLEGAAARERLPQVVCLLLDDEGEIAGVNSVYSGTLALGGRPIWIYRSFLPGDAASAEPGMINAAFAALEAEFDPSGPIGLCVPIADRAVMESAPEAIWPDTRLMFAGYTRGDVQIRIRYFLDAQIGPGLPNSPSNSPDVIGGGDRDYSPPDRYRVEPFSSADEAGAEEVIALWRREGALPEHGKDAPDAEAERRVAEVIAVARERDEGVVGVTSAYLKRNEQLRMDLWHIRVFVAGAHRGAFLAIHLAWSGRDLLEQRFTSGEDTRAAGILYEVETVALRSYYNRALWLRTDFTFIGENQRGDHVRVHYFPGARAPLPG